MRTHTIRKGTLFSILVIGFIMAICIPVSARADTVKTYDFTPTDNASYNARTLKDMVEGDAEKVINIEHGSSFHINATIIPGSNTTINAVGSTIYTSDHGNAIFTTPTKTNYGSISNLKVIGGTWRSDEEGGRRGSMMVVSHGNNITFDGVDIQANITGHVFEIIACKNVTIKNCRITTLGKAKKSCIESAVQIDIATKASAPKLVDYGSQFVKGQTCKNVTITNNYISGASGVRVEKTNSEHNKYINKYHYNVTVKGNTMIGTNGEGLSLYNTCGTYISGNKVYSKGSKTSDSHTIGIHVDNAGKAPAALSKSKVIVTGNYVKGGRNGIFVFRHCDKKYGSVTITNNKAYCKRGKANAIIKSEVKKSAKKVTIKGNKTYKW